MTQSTEQLAVNAIRTLSIDAIEKANSGHPGLPMGAAPMAYKLWSRFRNHNPKNPEWFNRDRFVLSAGHGSMLLYSLLHLFGYDLSIEDLKQFRQWGSKTPGHPEFRHTPGVDATTGPLGQGLAMAVGMAMAERHLAGTYNKDNYNIVDHFTYAICGDGDLMEGVSAEAASLAGHLKLGRLVVLYDSNDISLDGDLIMSFSEKVKDRFSAYGWQVLHVEDGNNLDEIEQALAEATSESERPTFIEVKTTIGYGAPNKSGKNSAHGSPLGSEEAKGAKASYEWDYEEDFFLPEEVKEHYQQLALIGEKKEAEWQDQFAAYKKAHPDLARELEQAINQELSSDYANNLPEYKIGDKKATRETSSDVINALAKSVPQLFGGAADLASSTKTIMKVSDNFGPDNYQGRNVWFGVREFAMAAAVNGMALHGGVKPFGSTFFVFSDYLKPALRLSALMKIPAIYVFTHDSIAVGEDGPTHEPVEQLAGIRAIPDLTVFRPADGNETREAWKFAVEQNDRPTALVLTRQGLPTLQGTIDHAEDIQKGAYVVSEAEGAPQALLLAAGSEVSLAVASQEALSKEGIKVSVVSMPSWDRFEAQSKEYKDNVIPPTVKKRLAIEMGTSLGWHKYIGDEGDLITIDRFGASAEGNMIQEKYGFSVENVVNKVKALIK